MNNPTLTTTFCSPPPPPPPVVCAPPPPAPLPACPTPPPPPPPDPLFPPLAVVDHTWTWSPPPLFWGLTAILVLLFAALVAYIICRRRSREAPQPAPPPPLPSPSPSPPPPHLPLWVGLEDTPVAPPMPQWYQFNGHFTVVPI